MGPLGVLGGSFDPVHRGHVAMARHVLDKGLVSEVVVIPAHLSPFKNSNGASGSHRLAMARLAFAGHPDCRVDGLELDRPRPSYMIDTLKELGRRQPGRPLNLIIGADNLAGLDQWHEAREIYSLVRFLVLGRRGHGAEEYPTLPDGMTFLEDFDQRVSSTQIRAMLADGVVPGDHLDSRVIQYIAQHGLYS